MRSYTASLIVLFSGAACTKSTVTAETAPRRAAPTRAVVAKPVADTNRRVEITDPSGARVMALVKRDDGAYNIKDAKGVKIGKVKVQPDRVKAKDASGQHQAKVTRRDDGGYKLSNADGATVFKAKLKGPEKLKLTTEQGEVLGKVTGGHKGTFGDVVVEVRTTEKGLELSRGGAVVATMSGTIKTEAAVMWGFGDLSPFERAAVVVYVMEHR